MKLRTFKKLENGVVDATEYATKNGVASIIAKNNDQKISWKVSCLQQIWN